MRILIVAATDKEIAPFAAKLGIGLRIHPRMESYKHRGQDIHLLISEVGMVATAAWCSQILTQNRYDVALNLGVCGSFDPAIKVTQVVHVISDRIAELGAENGDDFLTLQDLELLDKDEFSLTADRLLNSRPPCSATLRALPPVDGITVNTVHGNENSIEAVKRRVRPQIESMEGAAFMYACMIHRVPFAQVRAVSNIVEKRNRETWNLAGATRNLSEVARDIVEEL